MKPLSFRWIATTSTLFVLNLLSPTIAFAQESEQAEQDAEAGEILAEETGETTTSEKSESQMFTSDGSPVVIEDLGIRITPPAGWEVMTKTASLTVIMNEPKNEEPSYDKPKYRRNITVATSHSASPIDEKRAAELKEQMMTTFGKDPLVKDFQIIEHKFFNYKGVNDGLLLYTSLTLGEYPMMQMHILVSGEQKQFLLTYTDLAERFSEQQLLDQAWQSMISVEVTGDAPSRYEQYARWGALGGFAVLLLGVAFTLRHKAKKRDFLAEADSLLASDDGSFDSPSLMATLHGKWNFGDDLGLGDDDFESFSSDAVSFDEVDSDDASRTKKTSYVSNY